MGTGILSESLHAVDKITWSLAALSFLSRILLVKEMFSLWLHYYTSSNHWFLQAL
jgi:hypothetical protein